MPLTGAAALGSTPELREDVRSWVEREVVPRAAAWEAEGAVPPALFRSFADHGLLARSYPTDVGGAGGSFVDQLVVAEELYYAGYGGVALSLLGHAGIALQPLLAVGSPEQQRSWLLPALRGEQLVSLAVSEPGAGSDVGSLATRAERVEDGWQISGRKVFVTLGTQADLVVVAARTSEGRGATGISLFVVPLPSDGVEVIRAFDKLGMRSSDTAEIAFDRCVVPPTALLGEPGAGFKAVMRQFQAERLILAVGGLALAQHAMDVTIARMRSREQFGRPLSEFQALRHRVADAAANVEALRTFAFVIGDRYGRGEYPVAEISMVKLLAAQAAFDVVDEMLQLCGGWGYVADLPLERIWRDVRLMRIGGGTDEIMRELVARTVFAVDATTTTEPHSRS